VAKFRWHRGSLEESLKTEIEVMDFEELYRAISEELGDSIRIDRQDITIERYGFDNRLAQEMYIVKGETFGVIGFTNTNFRSLK
jgi:hypothetical protein